MQQENQNIYLIKEKLVKFRNRQLLVETGSKYLLAFKYFLILLSLSIVAESLFSFPIAVRTILALSIISTFIGIIILNSLFFIWQKYFKLNLQNAGRDAGKLLPDVKDEIINTLQITENENVNYSSSMVAKAVELLWGKIKTVDLYKLVPFDGLLKRTKAFSLVCIFYLIFLFLVPGQVDALERIVNFNKTFSIQSKIYFTIKPGNHKIAKGEAVNISCEITGRAAKQIQFYKKKPEQVIFEKITLNPDSLGIFAYTESKCNNSFEYYFELDDFESEKYKLDVINFPMVSSFELEVIPPAYSRLQRTIYKNNANIFALKGSRLNLKAESNKEIESISLKFNTGKTVPLNLSGKKAEGSFYATRNKNFQFELIDYMGYKNKNPIVYTIEINNDDYPGIQILEPEKVYKLGKNNWVQFVLRINDDFGFSKLNLNYKLSQSLYEPPENKYHTTMISQPGRIKESEIFYLFDLDSLTLAAGDEISYFFEVFDNDVVSGPKSARSDEYLIKVPSIEQLLDEVDSSTEMIESTLRETFKQADELKKEFGKISDELKRDEEKISWDEKQKIEDVLEKFESLLDEAHKADKELTKLKNTLNENNLLSDATMEKYLELQKLFDEIDDEDLLNAFKDINNLLDQMNRNQLQSKFDKMKFNEEQFRRSIERTLNLMKRIQVEQKLDELIKQTERIAEEQKSIEDEIETGRLDQKNELEQKQKNISNDFQRMKNNLKNLIDKMKELQNMPVDQAKNILSEFNKQENTELSDEAVRNIAMRQYQQAMEKQEKIGRNMQSLNQKMKSMQQGMQRENKIQTLYDLVRIMENILELSDEVEKVLEDTKNIGGNSPKLRELATAQNDINQNLHNIFKQMQELGNKSFSITPEMGLALGKARGEIAASVKSLFDSNRSKSINHEKTALANLNRAALLVSKMIERMMSGGGSGSGGGMSMMQQLQQMSEEQMSLNMQTRKMGLGKLSQAQMAQMQRLAQQQDAIRKSLEQMNREAKESGQSKSLAANIEKILKEMGEIVTEMNTTKLDNELIQQQERILSKMLDAQRSLNEKDFEEERISRAGNDIKRLSPSELMKTEYGGNILREELLKAVKEGYNKDYENLIRNYFKALEKEQSTIRN